MYYDHISVQTGGPNAAIGAHKEHYLSAAAIDPEAYPAGLADGKAHLMRVVYTPGFDADLIPVTAPPASVNHIKYWVEEGPIRTTAYPHSQGTGSWKREGTGMLRVYLDNMDTPMLALPIDLGHTLGLDDGRAWVGLTASTGRRFQNHYVLGWQFCEGRTGCRQPMTSCEAFGCNPCSRRRDTTIQKAKRWGMHTPSSLRACELLPSAQTSLTPPTPTGEVEEAATVATAVHMTAAEVVCTSVWVTASPRTWNGVRSLTAGKSSLYAPGRKPCLPIFRIPAS